MGDRDWILDDEVDLNLFAKEYYKKKDQKAEATTQKATKKRQSVRDWILESDDTSAKILRGITVGGGVRPLQAVGGIANILDPHRARAMAKNPSKLTKLAQTLEAKKEQTSREDLSHERIEELEQLDQRMESAKGSWETFKTGVDKAYDMATHPSEWTTQGIVEGVLAPENFLSFGVGGVAAKVASKPLLKVAIGSSAGAAENLIAGSAYEYAIQRGEGKSHEDSLKVAQTMAPLDILTGGVAGGIGGALTKSSQKNLKRLEANQNNPETLGSNEAIAVEAELKGALDDQKIKQETDPRKKEQIKNYSTQEEIYLSKVYNDGKEVHPHVTGRKIIEKLKNSLKLDIEISRVSERLDNYGIAGEYKEMVLNAYARKDMDVLSRWMNEKQAKNNDGVKSLDEIVDKEKNALDELRIKESEVDNQNFTTSNDGDIKTDYDVNVKVEDWVRELGEINNNELSANLFALQKKHPELFEKPSDVYKTLIDIKNNPTHFFKNNRPDMAMIAKYLEDGSLAKMGVVKESGKVGHLSRSRKGNELTRLQRINKERLKAGSPTPTHQSDILSPDNGGGANARSLATKEIIPQSSQKIEAFGDDVGRYHGQEAVEVLLEARQGHIKDAFFRDDIGSITLPFGKEGNRKSDGWGLAKIAKYHPEALENLEEIVESLPLIKESENRYKLGDDKYFASIRREFDGVRQNWVLIAFEKRGSDTTTSRTNLSDTSAKASNQTTLESVSTASNDTIPHSNENINLKRRFNALSSHPRFDELIDMRKDILAKDTRYVRRLENPAFINHFNKGEGYETSFTPPIYSRNYAADFYLTKNDIRDLLSGRYTQKTLDRLHDDLERLDIDPNYVPDSKVDLEGTHANKSEDVHVNADGELVDENGHYLFAKGADNILAGALGGFEEDEEGNITFNPYKALLAVGGYAVAKRALKSPHVKAEAKHLLGKAVAKVEREAGSGNPYAQAFLGKNHIFTDPHTPDGKYMDGAFSDRSSRQTMGEIDDRAAKLTGRHKDRKTGSVGDFLEHVELFRKYPHLKDIDLILDVDEKNSKRGFFQPYMYRGEETAPLYPEIQVYAKTPDEAKSTLLHELQHAIQDKERWARGGSPSKDLYQKYRRLHGEQVARATQARMEMTPEQRRAESFQDTLQRVEGEYKEPIMEYGDNVSMSEALRKKYLLKDGSINEHAIRKEAVPFRDIEYTFENFKKEFPNGKVQTPIGTANISSWQFKKIRRKGRTKHFGLIKPTLEKPSFVVDFEDTTFFFKAFRDNKGVVKFGAVVKDRDGMLDVTSNYALTNRKFDLIAREGKLVYPKSSGGVKPLEHSFKVNMGEPADTRLTLNSSLLDESIPIPTQKVKPKDPARPNDILDLFKGNANEVLEEKLGQGKGHTALYEMNDLHVRDKRVHLSVDIKNPKIKKYLSDKGWKYSIPAQSYVKADSPMARMEADKALRAFHTDEANRVLKKMMEC